MPERPAKPGTTVYLYELAWILPSIAIPVGMLAALTVTAFGAGLHLPGVEGRVPAAQVAQTAPFDAPGVRQTGPGRYEVVMTSQIWAFAPNEIRVPAGATVTFVATSKDVVHGLLIPRAHVNVMLLPGQIARVTATFERPGEYPMFCHEYCGIAHHTMWGKVIVEPRS
ncbi:MAG TPA: cytochrome c oxidase subunit II [Candidatus Binatia bacterium]|nr:cytochrome c oxidase subunit II [Candidatus Binatia bacterium]